MTDTYYLHSGNINFNIKKYFLSKNINFFIINLQYKVIQFVIFLKKEVSQTRWHWIREDYYYFFLHSDNER